MDFTPADLTPVYHGDPEEPTRLAFAYIRVSSVHDDMYSPEQQYDVCEKFARDNNIKIIETIPDLDLSGRTFTKRKVASMIERIRRGEASTILIWQYSRWARNAGLGHEYVKQLENAGGQLIAVTENADTKTTSGRLMRGIYFLFAEHYSDMVGDNWKLTHDRRLKHGLPTNGRPRFGYTRCPDCKRHPKFPQAYLACDTCHGVFRVDPVRGKALEAAYKMYVTDNKSFTYISNEMRDRGIRSSDGFIITEAGWKRIMDTGFAAGLICIETRPVKDGKQPTPNLRYYRWVEGVHPRIISPDLWKSYKEKRLGRAALNSSQLYATYSVSGLARCGEVLPSGMTCLSSLVARQSNKKPRLYFQCKSATALKTCKGTRCSHSELEAAIREWVTAQATDDGVALLAMQHAAERDDSAQRLKELHEQEAIVTRRRKRLLEAFLAEIVEVNDYRDKKEELDNALKAIQDQLATVGAIMGSRPPASVEFQGLLEVWDRLTPQELNSALKALISYVVVQRPARYVRKLKFTVIPRWHAEPVSFRNTRLSPANPKADPPTKSDTPPDQ